MRCECCGREVKVLIEIGAVAPKVCTNGRCCVDCCAYILRALEGSREDRPVQKAELIAAGDEQVFVDETGEETEKSDVRFGMKDAAGKVHYFCVRKLPMIPEMIALEIYPKGLPVETNYQFRVFGHRKNDEELLGELLGKMEMALLNPVIRREGGHSYLRERGYVQIENDSFQIDGKRYDASELAEMLSPYEGFLLTYQIRDALGDIPDRDTYYLPVQITDDLLLEELEEVIVSAGGKYGFISYKDMNIFDIGFSGICDKLELYYRSNPPGIGKAAGLKLIRRLEEVETDDDIFPEYQIGVIRELIGE